MKFGNVTKFVDRHYSRVVDACIVATLFFLWLRETVGGTYQLLLLGSMIAFASVAIVAYFVRLFSTQKDADQALVGRSESVASRDEAGLPKIYAQVWRWALDQDKLDYIYRDASARHMGLWKVGPSKSSVALAAIATQFESPEEAYTRRLAEVINTLCANPYGIEYEFHFKPDTGLRITRSKRHESEALTEEPPGDTERPIPHLN